VRLRGVAGSFEFAGHQVSGPPGAPVEGPPQKAPPPKASLGAPLCTSAHASPEISQPERGNPGDCLVRDRARGPADRRACYQSVAWRAV